ncbi:MAG: TonB family protein [Luteibaculaceae bacterium]|jgi:TonB family protein
MNWKKLLFLLVSCVVSQFSFGQKGLIPSIVNLPLELVERVDTTSREGLVFLRTPFASSHISNPKEVKKLEGKSVQRISLIFTTYRSAQTFQQKKLNTARLYSLKRYYSACFKDFGIEWRLVGQTGCLESENGGDFFHGFILEYDTLDPLLRYKGELAYLKKIMAGKKPSDPDTIEIEKSIGMDFQMPTYKGGGKAFFEQACKDLRYPISARYERVRGTLKLNVTIDQKGKVDSVDILQPLFGDLDKAVVKLFRSMQNWNSGVKEGKSVRSSFEISLDFNSGSPCYFKEDFSFIRATEDLDIPPPPKRRYYVEDSTFFNVMKRNQWDNVGIVCDLTGSMVEYAVQSLIWVEQKMKEQEVPFVSFFNDGGFKQERQKEIGKTGGIFSNVKPQDFEEVLLTAVRTMMLSNGGGFIPENDIEALIDAQEKCPECESLVLIAGNNYGPRDMELVGQLQKPVHVILCGFNGVVWPSYLKLAMETGGSIHTLDDDLDVPEHPKNGEVFRFEDINYLHWRGAFVY